MLEETRKPLRDFLMRTYREYIQEGKMTLAAIRETAEGWHRKGWLTEADIEEIDRLIAEQDGEQQ